MSIYPYDTDYELVQALGKRVGLKRMGNVQSLEDLILHDSRWWRVTDYSPPETGVGLELEIAGPSGVGHPETTTLEGDESALVITTSVMSGLQFIDGALQDVPWPGVDLIYVRRARRRRGSLADDEEVYGIFSLRYHGGGGTYYAPVDQELQPGVSSHGLLDPRYDLILDWEPIDVTSLLEWLEGGHGEV